MPKLSHSSGSQLNVTISLSPLLSFPWFWCLPYLVGRNSHWRVDTPADRMEKMNSKKTRKEEEEKEEVEDVWGSFTSRRSTAANMEAMIYHIESLPKSLIIIIDMMLMMMMLTRCRGGDACALRRRAVPSFAVYARQRQRAGWGWVLNI